MQTSGQLRGGHCGIGVGDFHICNVAAGAHSLCEVGGRQGDGRIDIQVEGEGLAAADRILLVAGGRKGDGIFTCGGRSTGKGDSVALIAVGHASRNRAVGDGGIGIADLNRSDVAASADALGEQRGIFGAELDSVVHCHGHTLCSRGRTSHIVGVHCCGTDYGVGNLSLRFSGRGGGYGCAGGGVQVVGRTPCIGHVAVGCLRAGSELCAAAEAEVGVAADRCHCEGRCIHRYHDTLGVGSRTAHIVGVDGGCSGNNISGVLGGRNRDAVAIFLVAPSVGDSARRGGGLNR